MQIMHTGHQVTPVQNLYKKQESQRAYGTADNMTVKLSVLT